jgi:hypothetical protein
MRRLLAVAVLAVVLLLTAGCDRGPRADENDPWQVVHAYLDALNAADAGAIEDLVSPALDPDAEIAERLERLGGRHLGYQTILFRGIGMDDLTTVDLTLRDFSSEDTYQDKLSLARSDGRWWLQMGGKV